MDNKNIMLTVFTPTYNRGYCLERLYQSLLKQKCKGFVWMIIDDGSTDNTKMLIKQFQNEGKISISYYYQKNAGKMMAHNKAVNLCWTELFMCLDSDDILVDNAIELILNKWENRVHVGNICGIIAPRLMIDRNNKALPVFPLKNQTNTLGGIYSGGYKGETALVFRTELIKRFPFPLEPGEKFIPEGLAYDKIDESYLYIVIPDPLMICAYQQDGYTQNIQKVYVANPRGSIKSFIHDLKISTSKIKIIKLRTRIIAFGLIANMSIAQIFKLVDKPIVTLFLLPLGYLYKEKLLKSIR